MASADAIRVLCVGTAGDAALAEVSASGSLTGIQVRTGSEAIERLRKEPIDAVVIGPTIDRPTLLPLLDRLRTAAPAVPIIVAGNPDDPEAVVEALDAGATRYERLADPASDLLGQVAHLVADRRVDASLDRHRELAQTMWAAIEAAVDAESRAAIEATVHRHLADAEIVDAVWIGKYGSEAGVLTTRQPWETTMDRSQLAAIIGKDGPAAIETAVETDEIQTVDQAADGSTGVILPIGESTEVILLAISPGYRLASAERSALKRFARVLDRLVRRPSLPLAPGERAEALMELISHEIRNPLTTALSGLQTARETGEATAFDQVEQSLEEIDRTISTLNTLFDSDRVEPTETKRLEETAIRAWEATATPTANLEIEPIGALRAHHDLVERVFANLFQNAIQYGNRDVTVTIGRLDDGFYVADDGPGITPGARDAVFDWGYTSTDAGFGLGLALVQEIAGLHGWSIDLVESGDGGARFEFTGIETLTDASVETEGSELVGEDG